MTIDVLLKMPFLTRRTRAQQRITIAASDIDLVRGEGPELRGPAEALLMALAGRHQVLPELAGPAKQRFEPSAGVRFR